METWECKGRALLRYGRNVVLDVRWGTLAEQERDLKRWKWALHSKSKKANPKPWSLWLRTVSEPGEKFSGLEGRNGAGVSIYLPSLVSEGALPSVPWRESSGKDGITKCFLSLVNWHSGMDTPFSPLLHCSCCLSVSPWSLCLSVSASSSTFGHWETIAPIYLFPHNLYVEILLS